MSPSEEPDFCFASEKEQITFRGLGGAVAWVSSALTAKESVWKMRRHDYDAVTVQETRAEVTSQSKLLGVKWNLVEVVGKWSGVVMK